MALFRLQRGGYDQSIETTVVVKTKEELIKHINSACYHPSEFKEEDIKIEKYAYHNCPNNFDRRNGWHTHSVSITMPGHENYMIIGFLSEDL